MKGYLCYGIDTHLWIAQSRDDLRSSAVMTDNLTKFIDTPTTPDPIHVYEPSLALNKTPIVIDNGCYKCRAGWASESEPKLVFKNVVARLRSKKEKDIELLVGSDITNIEVVRAQLRSPFERNVLVHLESQEQLLDYTFSHLGIDSSGSVAHPIVMTEALANPNFSRNLMSELLFECYGVPEVTFGVDSLFSLHHSYPSESQMNALIVACGYNTTHIIPVLEGQPQCSHSRRINLGGLHSDLFMQRLLQLKHSAHFAAITLSRAEELVRRFCRLTTDFQSTLKLWSTDEYYNEHARKIQLPFTQLAEDQEKLRLLIELQQLQEDDDNEELFYRSMKQMDIDSVEELQATINQLNNSIHHIAQRILEDRQRREGVAEDVKDTQKRKPKVKEAQPKKPKIDRTGELSRSMPMDTSDVAAMATWLENLRQQRQKLLNKRAERRQRRTDMTKRRTVASHQRMKILTALAQGTKKNKVDTFGKNDDDWDVYKEINKDAGDSDSEAEQDKLDELETMLKEYDDEFKHPNDQGDGFDVAEYYRVHVGTEQIRVPEVLFQPSMIGMDQAGIAETISFVLKKFTAEEQTAMTQRVFLTGSCSSFPSFEERLSKELQEMLPFQSKFSVHKAQDPVLGPWKGACKWTASPLYSKFCISKQDYDEYGGEYIKTCPITNQYVPTPASLKIASQIKKEDTA
ncbi:hypothetical protein CAPTEDRAFT_223173 [Capitella teleta]|uniref:Uncharacterized protein n=1 Tax=Capitella teleta TaxID=283909 RepID=R7TII5_CAPTE|nr:hypothetical protein CAPTEDRAFT_223173 [Capitella teleta]|eukprot:ELT93653.1 hypothetical protein CAPTEDRAFT_223173 [Capitella teleta]